VSERDRSWGLVPELKLTLRCLSAVRETVEYAKLSSRIDFTVFERAVEVRNRLTHPKAATDVRVNDADVSVVQQAIELLRWATEELTPFVVTSPDGRTSKDPLDWEDMVQVVLGPRRPETGARDRERFRGPSERPRVLRRTRLRRSLVR
jgi:hypothetical protein